MNKTLKEIKSLALSYQSNDVSLKDINYLIKETFSLSDADIFLKEKEIFDDTKVLEDLDHLKEGMPVEYILGYANFLNNRFLLNKDTLIPRNETEEKVLKTKDYISEYKFKEPTIIDVGTGSGCIAISLDKMVNGKIIGLEISASAFEMAIKNNRLNKTNVTFVLSNLFNNLDRNTRIDVLISNPPYISEDSYVQESVRKHEPSLALFAKNQGLEFYERIFKKALNF